MAEHKIQDALTTWDVDNNLEYATGDSPYATGEDAVVEREYDEKGRLIDPQKVQFMEEPEDYNVFVSQWKRQVHPMPFEQRDASKMLFAHHDGLVHFHRLDVFQYNSPPTHFATTDREESRRYRYTEGWTPVRSIFFVNVKRENSIDLVIEYATVPNRCRFRPMNRLNKRDLTSWVHQETINAYRDTVMTPGSLEYFIGELNKDTIHFNLQEMFF
jgi:hypothetical protein